MTRLLAGLINLACAPFCWAIERFDARLEAGNTWCWCGDPTDHQHIEIGDEL